MMNPLLHAALFLSSVTALHAATLTLTAPLDYQVTQRESKDTGRISIIGNLIEADPTSVAIEARLIEPNKSSEWQKLSPTFTGGTFHASLAAPAGGWYRLEVRALGAADLHEETAVEHIGVGEIFVVAGQSNSANYGAEPQSPQSGRVSAFDGKRWQPDNDPQPGAGGQKGSFMPPFADAIVQQFHVPVGLIACGVGGTSVRHWLPRGLRSPYLPTNATSNLPSGEWESTGKLFENLVSRTKPFGPHGFRAVLWHQGESDANQKDPSRTLPGNLYREYLEKVIRQSRQEIGWEAPWFVAQVSYHTPGDESSPDIRAAQASLWKDGIALEGPDTDQLKGDLRENGGRGVHFSGPGLREHAARWVGKVAPWLEKQLTLTK